MIRSLPRLSAQDAEPVLGLVRAATAEDGLSPLSEHVLLHLRHGGDVADVHYIADFQGALAGYAHLDATDAVQGPSIELAVHPRYRQMGVGRALVEAIVKDHPGRMRLWAHGESAGASQLADALGFTKSRVLLQMKRSLDLDLPRVTLPEGIVMRSFLPGLDDEPWLALNARAFANHPEQGQWTLDDLRARMAEPWFSPAGFLIAEEAASGLMVGFHWTKVHGAQPDPEDHSQESPGLDNSHKEPHGHAHDELGEVYVVGVDPSWEGRGLGRAITVAGLVHLRSLGLQQAMLYVDATNEAAISLYKSLGFEQSDTDVLYQL